MLFLTTNYPKHIIKSTLVLLIASSSIYSFADNSNHTSTLNSAIPINPATATNPVTPMQRPSYDDDQPTLTQAQLPNAYELLKKINAQQLQMARLAREIENLQLQVADLNHVITNQTLEQSSLKASVATLKTQLKNESMANNDKNIESQTNQQTSAKHHAIDANITPQNPYLVPPKNQDNPVPTKKPENEQQIQVATDNHTQPIEKKTKPILLTNDSIPKSSNHNALKNNTTTTISQSTSTQSTADSKSQQGKLAYVSAYSALKNDSVDAGIKKMRAFITNYPTHELIPSAHYWLGEFYLKQSPPNVALAETEFKKVITDFKDAPTNNKQSKALYRLATFAKSKGQSTQAKKYIANLTDAYPDSTEAKLARSVQW